MTYQYYCKSRRYQGSQYISNSYQFPEAWSASNRLVTGVPRRGFSSHIPGGPTSALVRRAIGLVGDKAGPRPAVALRPPPQPRFSATHLRAAQPAVTATNLAHMYSPSQQRGCSQRPDLTAALLHCSSHLLPIGGSNSKAGTDLFLRPSEINAFTCVISCSRLFQFYCSS